MEFSEDKLPQWQQEAQQGQIELLQFINDKKLQRAGRRKFQLLRDSGYIANFLESIQQKSSASSSATLKPERIAVHLQDTLRVEEDNSTTTAEGETDQGHNENSADQEDSEVKDKGHLTWGRRQKVDVETKNVPLGK